jgi:sporulation protein YqfC
MMKKRKMRHERPTISEILSNFADIPADLTSGMSLEMRGRNELLLCGCREILCYSPERIKLTQCGYCISIDGRRLTMTSYSDSRISIRGEIDRIDYCGGEGVEKREEK